MTVRACLVLLAKVWSFITYLFKKQVRAVRPETRPQFIYFDILSLQVQQHRAVKYDISALSPISRHRLSMVRKKVLVLDLDETLIHSHHDGVLRPSVKPGTPPDFILKVTIDKHPVRFFVHKRPHVDFFLSVVSPHRHRDDVQQP